MSTFKGCPLIYLSARQGTPKLQVSILQGTVYYAQCGKCGEKLYVFGESHLEQAAEAYGLEILGRMPIDPEVAKACDTGRVESLDGGKWLGQAFELLKNME